MLRGRLALLFVLLVGCGARTGLQVGEGPSGDASIGDGDATDAADAPVLSAECPTAIPAADGEDGGACVDPGVICEVDGDLDPFCNRAWTCMLGRWRGALASPKYASICPTPIDYGLDGRCPARRADIVPGGMCPSLGLTCGYADGPCKCTDDLSPRGWACDAYQPECTRPRPRLGSVCSAEGVSCTYSSGPCGGPINLVERCADGLWREHSVSGCYD